LKPVIVIAIPNGRPLKDGKPPKGVLTLARDLQALVPGFEVRIAHTSESRLSHAVNLLIDEFRSTPGAEWFAWLDVRCEVTAGDVAALLSSGKAVIGGISTPCLPDAKWDANFYPDVGPDDTGVVPVPELGTCIKIFHRTVFEAIEKSNPALGYLYDNSGKSLSAFCQEAMHPFGDYWRLLSPSQHLDLLCRNAHIGVFAHTGILPKRKGLEGGLFPAKEPYKPWLFKRLPPPVCAEDLPEVEKDDRPIKVCLQSCYKDWKQAQRLMEHLSASPLNGNEISLFESATKGYPKGPNEQALELMRVEWYGFKAILLLEPDCCPLTPDWLYQLSRDWDKCAAAGKLIMGSWHEVNIDHPTLGHLNGNLMFSPDLAKRITIPDVPDDKPWDTYLADVFSPVWARTGLIKNLNRHRTASVKQLSTPECGTRPPVLIHGVRDDSAWDYAATLAATK
jgi:hypothetical protein